MTINVAAELMQAGDEMRAALARIGDVYRELTPLQAPALTEQAIVAALKADPAMAGRVVGGLAKTLSDNGRQKLADAAKETVSGPDMSWSYFHPLQSLAVALAAASYRG